MSDAKRRYLRVYFDDLERDHPDVWFDPTCLSTFVRLLALAERAWPGMAEVPRSMRRADLEKLRSSGMIEYLPNHQYILRGWLAERTARADTGRANVGARWGKEPKASASTTVVPPYNDGITTVLPAQAGAAFASSFSSTPETERASEPSAWDAFSSRTGEIPGPKVREWLDELSEAHSEARVAAMIARLPKTQRTSVDYLKAVRDALRAEDFEAEKAERVAEKAAIAKKRAPVKFVPAPADISPEEAKRMAAEYLASTRAANAAEGAA